MKSFAPNTDPAPTGPNTTPVHQGVTVTAPADNSTVAPLVTFTASAKTTCAKGVSSMGIYTAPGVLAYETSGASLNAQVQLNPGTHDTVVQAWD